MYGSLGTGRAFAFLVVGWLGMSLVASLSAVIPMRILPGLRPGPDVAALVVLYVGLSGRGGPLGTALFAFALGYLADLSAGSPKGLHIIAAVLLSQAARLASARLMVRGVVFTAVVAALYGALYFTMLALMRGALDPQGLRAFGAPLVKVPLVILSTALFAPLVFAVLRRVDRIFTRDPRSLGSGGSGGGGTPKGGPLALGNLLGRA